MKQLELSDLFINRLKLACSLAMFHLTEKIHGPEEKEGKSEYINMREDIQEILDKLLELEDETA